MNHNISLGVSKINDFMTIIKVSYTAEQILLQGSHVEGGGNSTNNIACFVFNRHSSNNHHFIGSLGKGSIAESKRFTIFKNGFNIIAV